MYASYLIGELHIEGLDTYDGDGREDEDAASSSRQRIVEGDPRYQGVRDAIQTELKHIQRRWTELRNITGVKEAMRVPAVEEWLKGLRRDDRREAEKWIGRIYRIRIGTAAGRLELLKHTVLAFEVYRAKGNLRALEDISDDAWAAVVQAIADFDDLEATLYGQIVRQRISVIRKLQSLVDTDTIEKVIQRYLFKHLWLLDPAWERADGTEVMERAIKTVFGDVDKRLSAGELDGRLDIQYRKTAGQHVVIELKRPGVVVSLQDVSSRQISKYYNGVQQALDAHGRGNEPIDIVLVLGRLPTEWGDEGQRQRALDALTPYRARVVFYGELLVGAERAYAEYLAKWRDRDALGRVIDAIDDFGMEDGV